MKYTLPTDSAERKNYPLADGCLSYFPAALAGVANVSKQGNDKHNPGQPMHHARGKSGDHANCIVRHLVDVNDLRAALARRTPGDGSIKFDMELALLHEANQLAWRALALSQELHETYGGAPLAPSARLPEATPTRCQFSVDKGAYMCERPYGHEGACGSNEAERAQVPAGTDAAVDSVIAAVTGARPCLSASHPDADSCTLSPGHAGPCVDKDKFEWVKGNLRWDCYPPGKAPRG